MLGFIVMLFMIGIHAGRPHEQGQRGFVCPTSDYINIHEIMIEHIDMLSMHALAVSFDLISPAADRLNVVPPMFAKKTPVPPEAAFIGDNVITVDIGVTTGLTGVADAVTVATEGATTDVASAADVGAITAEAITGSVLTYCKISRD